MNLLLTFLLAWCARYGWEDGSLVRDAKLVLWLQEDVLQRRHAPRARKRKATPLTASMGARSSDADSKEALADEAKKLAKDLQTPLEDALAMLIDDRILFKAPSSSTLLSRCTSLRLWSSGRPRRLLGAIATRILGQTLSPPSSQ
jgi:hypothetical protein